MRRVEVELTDEMLVLPGRFLSFPVKVSWPELRLTDDQIVANTVARLDDAPEPFPDNSFFEVVIKRPYREGVNQ